MRIGGVRVFDGQRMRDAQDVVIRDRVIASVGDMTSQPADIDGRGCTLLPGLFDAHVHVAPEPDEALRQLATMGVTTALDMFSAAGPCSGSQLVAEGVPILAGTDTALPTAQLGVYGYGATLHAELELLVRAGLRPVQAPTAATSAPAKAFGLTDRGGIRPGLLADLVMVEGDPSTDIRDTRNVIAVYQSGTSLTSAVEPGTGRPPTNQDSASPTNQEFT